MSVSIVIPMYNEVDNVQILLNEVQQAMGMLTYEIIVVDDGSNDGTNEKLQQLQQIIPVLKIVRHRFNCGQSMAVISGIKTAQYEWIATIDGDGQNDPADIPRLVASGENAFSQHHKPMLVAGHRVNRNDHWLRKISSKIANAVRRTMLKDHCPDSACGSKVFRRDDFLRLPPFNHIHRFLPALFQGIGAEIVNVPVNHRPRMRGKSKYGVMNRLWVGIADLFGVAWLIKRIYKAEIESVR